MADFTKEIIKEEKQLEKSVRKMNSWMIVSCVLVLILVIVGVVALTHQGISAKKAGDLVVSFAQSQGAVVTVINVTSQGSSLYEVMISYQGQDMPFYVSKDGKYLGQMSKVPSSAGADNSDTTKPTQVTKSDKPVVQAFVFSYCPYGLQFEKALAPVYTLLKNKADINVVFIGAMHGEFEKVESLRQLCIQKNYGKDMLWNYLNKFNVNSSIGSCSGDAKCLAPYLTSIMKSLKIDESKITSCMTKDAPALYDADGKVAASLGVSGSPTFVINGAEVSVGRTPDAIKTAICDAFTTAPAECSQTLSTSAVSPSFGPASSSSASSSAASCG